MAHGAQRLHRRLLALGGADWRTERVRWPAAEPREGLLRAGGERERVVAPDRHCEEEVVVVTRSLVCTLVWSLPWLTVWSVGGLPVEGD